MFKLHCYYHCNSHVLNTVFNHVANEELPFLAWEDDPLFSVS